MSVQSLQNDVDINDYRGFLRHYLTCLTEGVGLQVPTKLTVKETKQEWENILDPLVRGYTSEFILNLTQLWLEIIEIQRLKETPVVAQDLLDSLTTSIADISQDYYDGLSPNNPS
jgi:hypothetical protein